MTDAVTLLRSGRLPGRHEHTPTISIFSWGMRDRSASSRTPLRRAITGPPKQPGPLTPSRAGLLRSALEDRNPDLCRGGCPLWGLS
jgi:glutamine synthetase